jgi:Uma2 family endonuclease
MISWEDVLAPTSAGWSPGHAPWWTQKTGLRVELLEVGMAVQLVTYRFTVQDYHRMAAAGIFHEDDRLELLQGEIVEMPPIGPGHASGVKRLMNSFLPLQVEGKVIISVQDPIHLGEYSEPQPDMALLKPRPDFYAREHPGPEDVFLVVEVMDSSASYDREVKVPLYASFGIMETWLVDVEQGLVEVYRAPGPEGYQQVHTLRRGARLAPQAFPELSVTAEALLG